MKNKTLLIMAAGMGSRFGGLKQFEPVGPNGEFLIDYAVYDAKKAGFNKVVFVIKKENEKIFKETIGNRIESKISVNYVFQDIDNLPQGFQAPINRVKPWGTGHAILCAKDVISEPFVIINADDFYGQDAYKAISDYIDKNNEDSYCLVGYRAKNTLSENGPVKRAICNEKDGKLISLVESSIEMIDGKINARPLDRNTSIVLADDTLVSMNMIIFNPSIFNYLAADFISFLEKEGNSLDSEYLIPDVLSKINNEKHNNVNVISTNSKWFGLTYKDDKKYVLNSLKQLINDNVYPDNLWKS